MINPAFMRYSDEATLIGAMVVGYGELELTFGALAGISLNQQFSVLHAFHSIRSETARINIADALCRNAFADMKFTSEYEYTLAALRHCLRIRNQYAHSQWGDLDNQLKFTNAETVFTNPGKEMKWSTITLDLLKEQEAYFEHTRLCALILDSNIRNRQLNDRMPPLEWPPKRPPPKLCSQPPKPAQPRKG